MSTRSADRRTVSIAARLHPDELDRVDHQADLEERSRSQMVRILIREALEAREQRQRANQ